MKILSILTLLLIFINPAISAAKGSNITISEIDTIKVSASPKNIILNLLEEEKYSSRPEIIISEKNPLTAWVLCLFLGPLGVHRLYLGTSVTTAVAYVVTGGGCGIIWAGDMIALTGSLFTKDLSKYEGNKNFFMWFK